MDDFFESYGSKRDNNEPEQEEREDFLEDYPVRQDRDIEDHNNSNEIAIISPQVDIVEDVNLEERLDLSTLNWELNELIGLDNVKLEVQRLIQYARVQDMRKESGLSTSHVSYHSVFYGNPGTGKTTIARIYGKMLNSMGLLSKGHLIETDRSGLVGNYIGQTANKTDAKIKEAMGGVLFIDEAYALYRKDGHSDMDYGREALEVIIKRMEDYRDDLVIIVAGYPKPMKEFLRGNEGIKSRFSSFIQFEDYETSELYQIFHLFRKKENYELASDADDLVKAAIDNAYSQRDDTFGNARFVRNFFEQIIRNHALRIGLNVDKPSITDLQLIEAEDVPFITKRDIE